MFCVRLMQQEEEMLRDSSCSLNMEKLLEARIAQAAELRRLLGLPSSGTNTYRLVNSEGDRLSGLIVDVFGDVAVVASSAAWVQKYRTQIEDSIRNLDGINHINWRPSVDILKEEGLDLSNSAGEISQATAPQRVKVKENDITYVVSLDGQKTGFYADQRENRKLISTLCKDLKVLDLCCYSGGFALNAAQGGVRSITGVDSFAPALELAKENVLLNNLDPCKISFVKQDATEFMKDAASRNESWDVVILDPPKLAPRKKEVLEGLTNIDLVLNLRLREEALIAKCLGRRICSECGGNYNIASIDIKSEKGGR